MLRYKESNWKYEKGFKTCNYDLVIDTINSSKTRKDQQTRIEKISLVAFLNREQRKFFASICRRLRRNDKHFYQNKNLHVTLFGFGPVEDKNHEVIRKKIQEFSTKSRDNMITISFYGVRPGTMYLGNETLTPVNGMSNGTVIAVGDVSQNRSFSNYTNRLTAFLLKDKKVRSILGCNFRRKLPTVWCTLGYYNKEKEFEISNDLQCIFREYDNLRGKGFTFPVSEISLIKSKYKNLRYPKLIQKFQL